tara:strand:+ start:256 stop:888 length:633 start_codon:yes stop_codon:yes gene_type:complete
MNFVSGNKFPHLMTKFIALAIQFYPIKLQHNQTSLRQVAGTLLIAQHRCNAGQDADKATRREPLVPARQLWQHALMLTSEQLNHAFEPVFVDIRERSTVVERFIDRNLFCLYMATLWANVVLSPEEAGIEEEDLPTLHDLVVAELVNVIGAGADLETVYRFISSKEGEKTMAEAQLNQTHKDLLQYFSSMILDPDGHKRWMEEIREDLKN